jgi:hypothetical protein
MNKALLFILLAISCMGIVDAIAASNLYSYEDGGDTSTFEHKGYTNVTNGDRTNLHHWESYNGVSNWGNYTTAQTTAANIAPYSGKSMFKNGDGGDDSIKMQHVLPLHTDSCFSWRMAVNVSAGAYAYRIMLMDEATGNLGSIGISAGSSTNWYYKPAFDTASTVPIVNGQYVKWAFCQNTTNTYEYYYNESTSPAKWVLIYTGGGSDRDAEHILVRPDGSSSTQWAGIDDAMAWEGNINVRFDPPVISSINLTSETPAITTEPYTTTDSTPTFKFITDENAWCRISSINQSYILMSTQCSGGEAAMEHTCTLSQAQALGSGIGYVYVACNDSQSNYHTILSDNEQLIVNVTTSSSSDAQTAINSGILQSKAAAAVIYTDKQVYIRALNSSQYFGTYDKVAVLGTKRWLFNYVNTGENYIGAPDLDSTVYVWENSSLTGNEITQQVARFINATYG